jgi:uncharacterized protein YndB with AHSA1/START domain
MISFENSIRIRRPVGDVFEFVFDPVNLSKWNYYVLHVEKTSSGSLGVGSTFHQTRKKDQQNLRVTEYEANRRLSLETIGGSELKLTMRLHFEATEEGTLIRDTWKLDTGRPRILERLAARRVMTAVGENLAKLKELLETGRTQLQDGRWVTHVMQPETLARNRYAR